VSVATGSGKCSVRYEYLVVSAIVVKPLGSKRRAIDKSALENTRPSHRTVTFVTLSARYLFSTIATGWDFLSLLGGKSSVCKHGVNR
jgi:hypothetical protein